MPATALPRPIAVGDVIRYRSTAGLPSVLAVVLALDVGGPHRPRMFAAGRVAKVSALDSSRPTVYRRTAETVWGWHSQVERIVCPDATDRGYVIDPAA